MKHPRYYLALFYLVMTAIGISLMLKVSIGVSSFNSFNVALSRLFHLRIGFVTILTNSCF